MLLVRALEKRGTFDHVHVQPVSGNAGTALGAAFLARKKISGKSGRAALTTLALGRTTAGLQELGTFCLRYELETEAYLLLLTARYPR